MSPTCEIFSPRHTPIPLPSEIEKRHPRDVVEVIESALERIDRFGWVQNENGNEQTGYCALAAIAGPVEQWGTYEDVTLAQHYLAASAKTLYPERSQIDPVAGFELIEPDWDSWGIYSKITSFNDHPDTTIEDVRKVFIEARNWAAQVERGKTEA